MAEDDRRLAHLLAQGLEAEGYVVDAVHDGEDALACAESTTYDVLILDVMMPRLDGVSVVRTLRSRQSHVPVLLLTARTELEDRVHGLDAGADDYLGKPFAFDELLARLRALVRRGTVALPVLTAGEVELDVGRHEVRVRGKPVELSATEHRLLEHLMRNPGRVLSRRNILERVWGTDSEPESNAVDLYVHYLRRKLGKALPLTTLRGVGYRLEAPQG
ncbi:MAG: response regulator transcription factor [Dehalococcoidia bacterium]